jgi:hypothetical protein
MSFFFQGNGFFETSLLTTSSIGNSYITASAISSSSLDMLNTAGNLQNITSVKDPILQQDAATKNYVDSLGININSVTLTSTTGTVITNSVGSFIITVNNLVLNGPCATFNVSKNSPSKYGHIVRTTISPGINPLTLLDLNWPPNSGLLLFKTDISYDGSYQVKIM